MTELKSLTTPRRQMPFGGDFDQLFNRAMSRWPFSWPELAPSSEPRALRVFDHVPSVEVKENSKSYNVSVELPGLDEKDVKVLVEDDMLTISGEKKLERTDDKNSILGAQLRQLHAGLHPAGRRRSQRHLGTLHQGRADTRDPQSRQSAGPGQAGRYQGRLGLEALARQRQQQHRVGEQQGRGDPPCHAP